MGFQEYLFLGERWWQQHQFIFLYFALPISLVFGLGVWFISKNIKGKSISDSPFLDLKIIFVALIVYIGGILPSYINLSTNSFYKLSFSVLPAYSILLICLLVGFQNNLLKYWKRFTTLFLFTLSISFLLSANKGYIPGKPSNFALLSRLGTTPITTILTNGPESIKKVNIEKNRTGSFIKLNTFESEDRIEKEAITHEIERYLNKSNQLQLRLKSVNGKWEIKKEENAFLIPYISKNNHLPELYIAILLLVTSIMIIVSKNYKLLMWGVVFILLIAVITDLVRIFLSIHHLSIFQLPISPAYFVIPALLLSSIVFYIEHKKTRLVKTGISKE